MSMLVKEISKVSSPKKRKKEKKKKKKEILKVDDYIIDQLFI